MHVVGMRVKSPSSWGVHLVFEKITGCKGWGQLKRNYGWIADKLIFWLSSPETSHCDGGHISMMMKEVGRRRWKLMVIQKGRLQLRRGRMRSGRRLLTIAS